MTFVVPGTAIPPAPNSAAAAANLAGSDEEFKLILSRSEPAFVSYIWGYELEDFHIEVIRFWRSFPFTLTLLPGGHGKSTLTRAMVVMEIAVNPNNRQGVVRKSEDDCKGPAGEVFRMLAPPAAGETDTPRARLHALFGPFKPTAKGAKWDTMMLNVAQRQIEDESFSLRWFGAGGPMLGYRTFRTWMDDVVTEKNSGTEAQRDHLSGWFGKSVETGPDPLWGTKPERMSYDGKSWDQIDVPERYLWTPDHYVIDPNNPRRMVLMPVAYPAVNVTGTTFDLQDLYLGRIVKDKRYKVKRYSCWRDKAHTRSLWMKKYPPAKLEAIKEADERDYMCRYENIPIAESALFFPNQIIRGGVFKNIPHLGNLGNGISKPKLSIGEVDPSWTLFLCHDPASGKSNTRTTWPSWTLWGYDRATEERYLVDLFRMKGISYSDMKRCFLDGNSATGVPGFWDLYHYQYAVVETVAFAQYFATDEEFQNELMKRNITFERHDTGRVGTQKWDPVTGVKTRVQTPWMNGLYNIPYALPSDRHKVADLISQFSSFPFGITDYVMTDWFFECAINDIVDRVISATVDPEYEDDVEWVQLPGAGGGRVRQGPLHKPKQEGIWL